MDPIKQRIVIAEACGWMVETSPHFQILHDNSGKTTGLCCGKHLLLSEVWRAGLEGDENGNHKFPDYLNDLNAMHEAKRALLTTFELCNTFQGFMLSERPHPHIFQTDKWTWGQSAEIEAISLLKTLDLWIED